MVIAIIYCAERFYRAKKQWQHHWLLERKQNLIELEQQRIEAEAQAERERYLQLQQEKLQALINEVNAFQQATQIRSYLNTLETSLEPTLADAQKSLVLSWIAWAHQQADNLDPILTGTYANNLLDN